MGAGRAHASSSLEGKTMKGTGLAVLKKVPSGLKGFDDITGGGLPLGRPTLVTGGAGSGKTVFAMQFLYRGAMDHNEPGIFVSFEESREDLLTNFASFGYDLNGLEKKKLLKIDYVRIERSEIEETGEYDLEALFIRLEQAIDSIGAKRVVLDTIEALFSAFLSEAIIRAELRRLFKWLKDKGVTTIITGEPGPPGQLTRFGLEEYVADCVIHLEHVFRERIATRYMKIIKYRGSDYSTNLFPYLVNSTGISVLPITTIKLEYRASEERVSTGIERLDDMLGGEGFYKGSTVLVSGTAGTGKTSLAAHFVDAACKRGEKCLYIHYEESPEQIIRNMRSIGIDMKKWAGKGLLHFFTVPPGIYGLETHLLVKSKLINSIKPACVVIDPISSLEAVGTLAEVKLMLTRLVFLLKSHEITCVLTNLTAGGAAMEHTEVGISSLIDTWINLQNIESMGEANWALSVVKSRGMEMSNQMREFHFTREGIKLTDVYAGSSGVLTGTARTIKEEEDRAQ